MKNHLSIKCKAIYTATERRLPALQRCFEGPDDRPCIRLCWAPTVTYDLIRTEIRDAPLNLFHNYRINPAQWAPRFSAHTSSASELPDLLNRFLRTELIRLHLMVTGFAMALVLSNCVIRLLHAIKLTLPNGCIIPCLCQASIRKDSLLAKRILIYFLYGSYEFVSITNGFTKPVFGCCNVA